MSRMKERTLEDALTHAEQLATGYRGAWTESDQDIVALALEVKKLQTNAPARSMTRCSEAELNTLREGEPLN